MSKPKLLSVLLIATLGASACSSSDDPTGPGDSSGTISATIDGVAWSADALGMNNGFVFGLEGTANGIRLAFSIDLTRNTVPGTVDLESGSTGAEIREGTETWYAVGGSGTMTVQTLTDSRATGTFQMVAGPIGGSGTGTRTIVNGTFDVTF